MPPSVNQCYANNGSHGRGRFKTKVYKEWERLAVMNLRSLQRIALSGKQRWGVELRLGFQRKLIWRCDIDNRFKALFDMICTVSGLEDKYLTEIVAKKSLVDCEDHITGTIYLFSPPGNDVRT